MRFLCVQTNIGLMMKREVTLELADGDVIKSKVDPSIKAFDSLKVSVSIHARLTRALAISVKAGLFLPKDPAASSVLYEGNSRCR